jgi:tryptophan synthase alpha chain
VRLEEHLRQRRATGAKLLVPYLTGGLGDWVAALHALVDAGADAVEIGVPFSDPVMDGPVIQAASQRALDEGATPRAIFDALAGLEAGVPLLVMTYGNLAHASGWRRFADELVRAGVDGAILPDVPLDEIGPWSEAADAAGVETTLLAAPTSSDERLRQICERSHGFVYGVSLMGVTGERTSLSEHALTMGRRLRAVTDKPVLLGVGVSTPEQAVAASAEADGVVIGSAVVRRLLEDGRPDSAAAFLADVRRALDAAHPVPASA